ncbi:hypothetical protein BK004_03285 [bacterium CG10_46_32]|nr:MAG: hypothetical protein BK004_03285 [bacterium CG10_46_32]PIR55949.1 MAG: hypothetical protein COU73_03315 [Parcubacteria group bacterium CG10_big_fil_rev_8_21_14_0_10_46_32]
MQTLSDVLSGGSIPEDMDLEKLTRSIFWLKARILLGLVLLAIPGLALGLLGLYYVIIKGSVLIGILLLIAAEVLTHCVYKMQNT